MLQSGNWGAEIGTEGLVWKSRKVGCLGGRRFDGMPGGVVDLDQGK